MGLSRRRPPFLHAATTRRSRWLARPAAALALCLGALLVSGFRLDRPRQVDYSDRSWSAAFSALCRHLDKEYPFTAWKGIDWRATEERLAPAVARAEATSDRRAFYLALRELVWQMRDGHAHLAGDDGGLRRRAIAGSYGLELYELDDHEVLAGRIIPGGAAAGAGMTFGAEIVRWNERPVRDAIAAVPVLWTDRPPATLEGHRLAQDHLLGVAPIGTHASVSFRNRGAAQTETRELVASQAPEEPSPCLSLGALLGGKTLETRVLPEGPGYVQIHFELPTLRMPRPHEALRQALASFAAAQVPGVVIDMRDNCGGADAVVPGLVAPFLRQPLYYEQPGIYQRASGGFVGDPRQSVTVRPLDPPFRGRLAVLVDITTVSAGEAIPYLLKGLPDTAVIGWHATQGSFGIGEKSVVLPAGLRVIYPHAQSLDEAGRVEVDGDAQGMGGVAPDRRLPLTRETFERWLGQGEDLPLREAIQFIRGVRGVRGERDERGERGER